MNVLVVNCGSSSLKFQLINYDNRDVLAKGLCERIGIDGRLVYEPKNGEKEVTEAAMPTHVEAIQMVLDALVNEKSGVIKSLEEVDAIGHRVLHGGMKITNSVIIDDEVIKVIEECADLGPLHNPANLMGINACMKLMPGVPNVAVFDTAFHQTMPPVDYIYSIPYDFYQKYKIRRYGFHGTSHKYVAQQASEMLGIPLEHLRIITCHLGNGSSVTAIKGGKSIDTSMGFTPLAGLPMGTRSGDIDPAIISFLCEHENKSAEEMLEVMNKESGVLGVSGVSSDFRDLDTAINEGNERAKLAKDIFINSVKKLIGAYIAEMGGVDAVVFTAGVGENDRSVRWDVCEHMEYLGIKVDPEKNKYRGRQMDISVDYARVRVLVIPTNEELVIAEDTKRLVEKAEEE